jgi:3-deoxy-7-phosphoheptulonate synthase
MFITLKKGTTKEGLKHVLDKIKNFGFQAHVSKGAEDTVIGVIGENVLSKKEMFESMFMVESVTPISKPYKLVSREFKKSDTIVKISKNISIGDKKIIVMAGPCSIETKQILLETGKVVKKAGADIIRGGAYKPRTSPYAFQGLGEQGLKYLQEVGKTLHMPTVTEAMTISQADIICDYADIIQVGARNVQNFDLLKHLGKLKKPVLLKRGMATTVKEFLMSAEYIASQGNLDIILCERGIRTFEDSTRFTLDLNAVPVMKKLSHLPVVVDASHGTGIRDLVIPMSKAAIACGADGLIVEVHPKPEEAFSDGPQSLLPNQFEKLMKEAKLIAKAVGREM